MWTLGLAAGVSGCVGDSENARAPDSFDTDKLTESSPDAGRVPTEPATTYEVDSQGQCPIERIRVDRRNEPGSDLVWVVITAGDAERAFFSVEMLVPSLGILTRDSQTCLPEIERYVFRAPGRPALEFQDADGKALLPQFSFAELLPRVALRTAITAPLAREGHYLGYPIRAVDDGGPEAPGSVSEVTVLTLQTDLLVGTGLSRRDDGTPRAKEHSGDYRYVDLTAADYQAQLDAGFNLFRVPRSDVQYVVEEPAFFALTEDMGDFPGLLYRSNFFGCVLYMDEPVARALNRNMFAQFRSPEAVVRIISEVTRGRLEAEYGRMLLPRLLDYAGFGVQNCDIAQNNYPVWEAIESAAWYELDSGAAGWCYEARLDAEAWSQLVRSRLGVEFPADVDSCLRYHFAMLTGAARHFERRWGVSIYGQMDAKAADRTFPLAYDLGASYFWLWTSDRDHHVPFDRQLQLARDLQRHAREFPRTRSPRNLTSGARTAVALPWGYACDQFALGVYGGEPRMWGSEHLGLDDRNPQGVLYGDVLRAALDRCARLLEAGERFDVIFLKPRQPHPTYDQVYRILATGEERLESRIP